MSEENTLLDEMTDESLMERVQRGDHEAFSVLVFRHTKRFYAAAYRVCSHADDAEDIVQDAFLKLWNRPEIWDSSSAAKFTTWFYRVVTNQAIDVMRRRKKTCGLPETDYIADDRDGQDTQLERSERDDILESAIQALPERQKLALNLCFYEGLSNKDAAEVLGVGVKAVESLLMRAKSGLRDMIGRNGLLEEYERKEGAYYGS